MATHESVETYDGYTLPVGSGFDNDAPLKATENGEEVAAGVDLLPGLHRVEVGDIEHAELDPPEFVIGQIIPRGQTTLLGAHGGAGKSILALIWALHVATGETWGGMGVCPGQVLYVSLEDGGDLIRYRLRRIMDVYGGLNSHSGMNLEILDGSQLESPLVVEKSEGGVRRVTSIPTFEALKIYCEKFDLVIIDNASDAYGANENDRTQVRSFIRSLNIVAQKSNAAIVLLAHIDKAAARDSSKGNSFSGSTAWHNTVRSRLALVIDDGQLVLKHEKSNLGPLQEPIALDWDGPVLVPMARDRVQESLVAEQQTKEDAEEILKVIRIAITAGDSVTAARSGNSTAWHALEPYPELGAQFRDKKGKKRVFAAVVQLLRDGRLVEEEYKNSYRHDRKRLVLARTTGADFGK